MYEVIQDEPSHAFKRAWSAAGRHLGSKGGESLKWSRNTLDPPMAEHLSFLLGNQLVFVFVEAAEFAFNYGKELFLRVSRDANAIPSVMPMNERVGGYEPALPGWGLKHAETGKPVDPGDLVSDELIEMTDWELHDFAIQIVRNQLEAEGKPFSHQSSIEIDPSIWFDDSGDRCWVVVRAARYPAKAAEMPPNLQNIINGCARLGKRGYFASIVAANADDPFDPDAALNGNYMPLYRGHGIFVKYEGLEQT